MMQRSNIHWITPASLGLTCCWHVVDCTAAAAAAPAYLECQQQQEGLYAVKAPVYKVAHEQVVGLGAVPAHLEQLHEVIELPVDVATWHAVCMIGMSRVLSTRCRTRAGFAAQHSQTVTGASTRCTLLSSTSTSRALEHRTLTSFSFSGSHRFSCSIQRSRSDICPSDTRSATAGRYTGQPGYSRLPHAASICVRRRPAAWKSAKVTRANCKHEAGWQVCGVYRTGGYPEHACGMCRTNHNHARVLSRQNFQVT